MTTRVKLLVLELGEVAFAIALWRRGPVDDPLRWSDPTGWLRTTSVENALIEAGRVVVLVAVGWMVFATALAIAARVLDAVFGTRRCFSAVSRVVPTFLATMVAAAIVTSAPVLAQPRAPVAPLGPVRDGHAPAATIAAAPAAPVPQPAPRVAAPATTAPPPAARVHVVAAGESLWTIARDRVGTDAAVLTDYWRALCDANRDRLPSGNVNVIHPGDTVVVPEPG